VVVGPGDHMAFSTPFAPGEGSSLDPRVVGGGGGVFPVAKEVAGWPLSSKEEEARSSHHGG
jgi:hypothetical protein